MSFTDRPDFSQAGTPANAREFAQRVIEEVNKRVKNADTRLRALGLACELNTGTGETPAVVIAQAEELMHWVITGEKLARKAGPADD